MKCLKGPVPRVVATASGEAAADQEMAHLLLAQELSGISRSDSQTNYEGTGTLRVFSPAKTGVARPIGWY